MSGGEHSSLLEARLDARTSPAAVSADARDLGGRGWEDARFCLRSFFCADLLRVAHAFENSMSLSSEGGSIFISSAMVVVQFGS